MTINANSNDFDKLIGGKKPMLVDFFATWCGPCQLMTPIVEEIADEHKEFEVIKLDIDEFPDIAARNNVMSVPTFIVFKDGKEIVRTLGAMPKELLTEKVLKSIK